LDDGHEAVDVGVAEIDGHQHDDERDLDVAGADVALW
jgi:hypothetical protein